MDEPGQRREVGRLIDLRILVERHQLHTGSKAAAEMLADWDNAMAKFVKVMPRDYKRALETLEAEREEAASVAAE